MRYTFSPKGVCAKSIAFEIDGDLVRDISFVDGCDGNLQGLAKLAEGRTINELVSLLKGIKCGHKATSCPDQLAKALKKHQPKKERPKKTNKP
jgi:uncharacterized protein (TIGR03905 family)